ncbi:PucR family transcriptional regulator, partial [Actinomadura fibrosa]
HGRAAAVGPPVELTGLARSLRWARQALDLAGRGVLPGAAPGDEPVMAADHAPTLVVLDHRELVEHSARRRLRPLLAVRPNRRHQYAQTLQAVLECGFNASAAAARLHVHPQTVRLRLRKLDELFGDAIHDPALHVELLMALRLWTATAERGAQPDWFASGAGTGGNRSSR